MQSKPSKKPGNSQASKACGVVTRRTRAAAERSDRRLLKLGGGARVITPARLGLPLTSATHRAFVALLRARGDRLLHGGPPEPLHGPVCEGGGSGDYRFRWCPDCHAIACWRHFWRVALQAVATLNLEKRLHPETLAAIAALREAP